MGLPARAHNGRRLRLFTPTDPPAGEPILQGTPVVLSAGEVDAAVTADTAILGFAAEAADPANQPEFTTGGATSGAGGAFVVDVHPNGVLVEIAYPGATFLMSYYANITDTAPSEPSDALIGTDLAIGENPDGVWVAATTAVGGISAAVKVVNIYKVPENSPTVSMVEVSVNIPQLT